MKLVWKLLRRHISVAQLAGFVLANLCGVAIVLLSVQFYSDVLPLFTGGDSLLRSDFVILNKATGMGTSGTTFTADEVSHLSSQPFAGRVGWFTPAEFRVDARIGIGGQQMLSTELFLESVPDDFLDTSVGNGWQWHEGAQTVPIILPRSYLTMYNFGFARSRSLPKLSDGLVGMIDVRLNIRGDIYRGRVVGFTSRLSSILVPQSFIDWANRRYAPQSRQQPSRLLLEVKATDAEQLNTYVEDHAYEVEDDSAANSRTTRFLQLLVVLVVAVGLVISLLSLFILMLSIYLLVEKNQQKLQNLLLIGYSPSAVARPNQLLTLLLSVLVVVVALVVVVMVRNRYMDIVLTLFPDAPSGTLLPSVAAALALLVAVSLLNAVAIYRKVINIWKHNN